MPLVNCGQCGSAIERKPSRLAIYAHHFCSRQCKHEYQRQTATERNQWPCDWCGKPVKKVPAKVMKHVFCGRDCAGKWRSDNYHVELDVRERIAESLRGRPNPQFAEMSRAQIGERHPRWNPSSNHRSTGSQRAERAFPAQPCEMCGAEPADRHHRDLNYMNNEPENIQFLCRKHHLRLHAALRRQAK